MLLVSSVRGVWRLSFYHLVSLLPSHYVSLQLISPHQIIFFSLLSPFCISLLDPRVFVAHCITIEMEFHMAEKYLW